MLLLHKEKEPTVHSLVPQWKIQLGIGGAQKGNANDNVFCANKELIRTHFKTDKSEVDLEEVGMISNCLLGRQGRKNYFKDYDWEWKHKTAYCVWGLPCCLVYSIW